MSLPTTRTRHWVTAILLLVPLIIGTVIAATTHLDASRAWSSAEEPAAAPAAGLHPTELVDARRAAGEAGAQAGFLSAGTGELRDGVEEMREQATTLPGQFGEAVAGAQQLHQGLVEIQAGVGQLGGGATEVADGVGQAVDTVIGLEAVQGQLVAAIDRTVRELEGTRDPQLVEARRQLTDLRGQVQSLQLGGEMADQLGALKDGSRQIADQLSVPGQPFHDGIYSATRGAQDLAYGLSQAQGGVDEAVAGVDTLGEGAQRIDDMATRTQDRIGAVQRALPVTQTTAEVAESPVVALAPMYALLIAALVMLGGAFAGATRNWWILLGAVLGLTGLGAVLLWLTAAGLTAGVAAWSALVLALGVLAAAMATRVLLSLLGPVAGWITAAVLGVAQIGLVGWVWKSLSYTDVAAGWQILANLSPLSWATAGLTTVGNAATPQVLWLALGVLGAMAVTGVAGVALGSRGRH
ncbi:YhgE/Pip domain-containing protein [Corynebacterium hylobatis]|uniref:YhgE/Pip domain-containing protein n=1 Tax=Corynebacterium hylobatis TaxID=1859290 RepID=A0A3S0B5B2_9CORY|nr:YhgE/Pip domain-containing protein [Corynebacterium hylobatis]RSZ64448.1 YhgE/Pip domain-containing protein [Corynebacterium hylobatis]